VHSLKLGKADPEARSTSGLITCCSSFLLPHNALNEAPSVVVDDPSPGPVDIDTFKNSW